MANYVEKIKVGSGEAWPVRDVEAHDAIGVLDTEMKTALASVWSLVYPIGAIYISVSETNPEVLFGGTWERIEDVFLLAASDSNYFAGETGGEAYHTLTIDETPFYTSSAESSGFGLTETFSFEDRVIITSQGAAEHNNMPPYLAVYMWKRTA